jgi:hypothetical protein
METIVLAVPEVTPAISTTEYRVAKLLLDVEGAAITIHVRGTNGERKVFTYTGADAQFRGPGDGR